MPTPTIPFSCRLIPEARQALQRHAALTGWSQAQLIESLILGLQSRWLARLNAGERQRYESCTMARPEFVEICTRSRAVAKDAKSAEQNESAELNGFEQTITAFGNGAPLGDAA